MAQMELTNSLAGSIELAHGLYMSDVPAYQVGERVVAEHGRLALLQAIGDASEASGERVPFPSDSMPFPGHTPPHVDGGVIGAQLHENLAGVGVVEAAHLVGREADPKAAIYFPAEADKDLRRYTGNGIADTVPAAERDEIYTGVLRPGVWTIFSGGNRDNLRATIHYFRRKPDTGNNWRGYTALMKDYGPNVPADQRTYAARMNYFAFISRDFSAQQEAGVPLEDLENHPGRYVRFTKPQFGWAMGFEDQRPEPVPTGKRSRIRQLLRR